MALSSRNSARVTAILGPTNTGKTHFAIERMLAHKTGMIGLPLRLLAREVYDRIVRLRGPGEVALITGEERIIPKSARFYVCTVEAMKLDIPVACLVVDEIQLCADPERGHIFTDRLLHARGEEETLFLGSDTMRGMIQKFIPRAWFIARPRFSDLAYGGAKKLTRLPRRSVVVGFSAEDVYGIADIVRRQRGGAAVVLGALSPRTRNAQVALYQSGEVDFLVATDAIGMGLNMDVDHVAFAAREKFDGSTMRALSPQELGQIAGRAGRYMNDGTFGVTGDCEPFDNDLVARIESHHYDPVRSLKWRSADLDFRSIEALLQSLDASPPEKGLGRARPASDAMALAQLARDEDIKKAATGKVRLLWDVCQLPDFRKLSADEHSRLVRTIFMFLAGEKHIPADWMARQIERVDVPEGDVATLSGRLAQIRTYTYAANRPGWTDDPAHWQAMTRAVEDRLSDALHEKLTLRFIDRRTSVLIRHLAAEDAADLSVDESGSVAIRGEALGRLDGFRFAPFHYQDGPRGIGDSGISTRILRAAAARGLEPEFAARAKRLADAPDSVITLSEHGKLWWESAIVGNLARGASPLSPLVTVLADDLLKGAARAAVQARLDAFVAARIATRLEPLLALGRAAEAKAGSEFSLPAQARAIAHRLMENFGSLDRDRIDLPEHLGALIKALRPFGVWLGRRSIYLTRLLRPDAAGLLVLLWGVWTQQKNLLGPPPPGLTSFPYTDESAAYLSAAGFHGFVFSSGGGRAIRFDMLERLEDELEKAASAKEASAAVFPRLISLLGISVADGNAVLDALGWKDADGVWKKSVPKRRRPQRARQAPQPDSPFAELARR